MKPIFQSISITIILLISTSSIAQNKELVVESNHSTVQFSVPIANGITRVTGKFTDYSIALNLVDGDLSKSNISATIQATSINTGIKGRDNHLRTADFFDVEKYPEITFKSVSIDKASDGYTVYGQFRMHGVTKDIKFPLKMTGKSGENTIGFSLRLILNRIDYGVGADFKHSSIPNFLSDDISVEIDFWTKKKKPKED